MDSHPGSVSTLLNVSEPESRIVRRKSNASELNSNGCENKKQRKILAHVISRRLLNP